MPLISVIVPVYNVEPYLLRCIESIRNQSLTEYELILVDDGGTDKSGKICDDCVYKDNRTIVIHQKNRRVSAARNAGLDVARGEWIAFVDPDDWIHREYLSTLLSGAQKDTDLVICECRVTDTDLQSEGKTRTDGFKKVQAKNVYANHYMATRVWGRLIRRDAIGALRFISGTEPVEDSCFNELFFRADMDCQVTEEKLYYYYMRTDSAIHSQFGPGTLNAVEPLMDQLESVDDKQKRRRLIKRCYKYIFSGRYGEMFTEHYSEAKKKSRRLFKALSTYVVELDFKERLIIQVFCAFPAAYRMWRISCDRSLLDYEKNKKKVKNYENRLMN